MHSPVRALYRIPLFGTWTFGQLGLLAIPEGVEPKPKGMWAAIQIWMLLGLIHFYG